MLTFITMNKYQIVPWFDSQEWHNVYNKLFLSQSSTIDKKEALNMIYVWKARSPFLPAGIESTLSLLEVYIQDVESSIFETDQLIRLAYSTALMRFVNHMFDKETSKGSSLYQVAKNLGVPDWIVELRHDTAHSNKLPSLDLLRQASLVSIDWLQKNYWDKHKQCISDYITGSKDIDLNSENKISTLLNLCVSLSIFSHSKCNIKNLAQIPDTEMKASLVNDAIELFGDFMDFSQLKTVSINSLNNLLHSQVTTILTSDATSCVKKVLFSEDSPILSEEIYNLLNGFGKKKIGLSKQYMQCFEGLFYFLHTHDLLLDSILELINTTTGHSNNKRCKLAALWISEILKSLKISHQFLDRFNKTRPDDQIKKKNDLILLFNHWYPNEKQNILLVNLHKPIPKELTDINFIQPIISTYNPFLTYFVNDLLNLCNPSLSNPIKERISTLAALVAFPEKFSVEESSKLYTVDDVDMMAESTYNLVEDRSKDNVEIINNNNAMEVNVEVDHMQINRMWSLASDQHAWSTCPIGLLPWQLKQSEE